jgi:hypothetical protein
METKETGQHAGAADSAGATAGPVTLADALAAHEEVKAVPALAKAKREHRDRLIRAVLAAGLTTKAELHRETGISEQHLGRIEQGRTSGAIPAPRSDPAQLTLDDLIT